MSKAHSGSFRRIRLWCTLLLGVVALLITPEHWRVVTRLLLAWNVTVWSYLLLILLLMRDASHHTIRALAQQEDKRAPVVLLIMSLAALASLLAIVWELAGLAEQKLFLRLAHQALTVATLLGSWLLLGVLFTLHYARFYYQSSAEHRPLKFLSHHDLADPNSTHNEHPNYWDFLYFSFTISVAAQTADVAIYSRALRKVVLGHAVLCFFFNFAILGLSINIAAGLLH
jgi:uncharacterized membrane protein